MSWLSNHFGSSDDMNLYLSTLKNHTYSTWDIHYEQALKTVNEEIHGFHQQIQQINGMSLTARSAMSPYQSLSAQLKSGNDLYGIAYAQHLDSIVYRTHKGIQSNSQDVNKLMRQLKDVEDRKRKLLEYDRKLTVSKNEWQASQLKIAQNTHNNTQPQNSQLNDNNNAQQQQQQMQDLQAQMQQLGNMVMNVQAHILDGDDNKQQNDGTEALREWLTDEVGLPQYFETFVENGFEDMDSLRDVNMDDLKEINITKLGHRKKLLACIEAL